MADLIGTVELRDSVRKVLLRARERKLSSGELRSAIVEAGWLGLSVSEASGGLEQPFAALAIVYQELGRMLAPHSFVGATLCLSVLARYSGSSRIPRELVLQTMEGTVSPMFIGSSVDAVAVLNGRCRGTIRNVLDVDHASHIVFPFHRDGIGFALVELPHPSVTFNFRPTWDSTRQLFDVAIDDVGLGEDTILFEGGAAEAVLEIATAQRDLALACDAVGGAEAIFAETLEYMLARRQFGRPIASFQALKHRCADLRTEMEASSVLVAAVCQEFSDSQGDWNTRAACARLYASEVYRKVTEEAVQFHGGIGFTWEHRCHRFLKRARLNDVLGGTPEQRKDAIAPRLFASAARTN